MHALFDSAPLAFVDGLVIVLAGVVTMAILEIEKIVTRRLTL